jgi:vacuolar iron transporter family protein
MVHPESHRVSHVGWLRASVLGANDGLISTSSLVVGVAAGSSTRAALMLAATAGLVAGALSMAAGEFVSVSSQADTEAADFAREQGELRDFPDAELLELTAIYEKRGLSPTLAGEVARALTAHDAIGTHVRDELGLTESGRARPLQAALASAAAFAVGAAPPVIVAATVSSARLPVLLTAISVVLLGVLGAVAARLGGAPPVRGAIRVMFWGALAMGSTALVGRLIGTSLP